MLMLTPSQMAIVDRLARQAMSLALARCFETLWPVAAERMGARLEDFVDTAVAHAQRHGLRGTPHVSRYVNLWFIWGAAFEDKPGFDWARELLADPRRGEAVKAHQLARQSQALLQRRGIAGLGSAEFAAADQRLMQAVSGLPGLDMSDGAPPSIAPPLADCDVAAIDLAIVDDGWRGEYRGAPEWVLTSMAAIDAAATRLRIDGEHPARFTLLGRPDAGSGLQVKVRMTSTCNVDHHPRLAWSDGASTMAWRGHEATSASWPVSASDPADPATSGACAIAAETEAVLHRLDVESCGLRDDGLPLGDLHLPVFVYDARPWLHQWRRAPGAMTSWPRGEPAQGASKPASAGRPQIDESTARPSQATTADLQAAFATSRLERDGTARDDSAWRTAFVELDRAFATSMDGLLQAFERSCGVEHARLDVEAGLLCGDTALAWNWRLDTRGPAAPPFMRLAGRLDLMACSLRMDFTGEVSLLGGRARVRLSLQGRAPLAVGLQRDAPLPPLADAMASAQQRFEFAFALELDPIATPESAALQAAGPVTGRLAGQAGLRPRVDGGSGYQWFLQLRLEAVSAVFKVVDPVLGITLQRCPLLPPTTLVDWSTG